MLVDSNSPPKEIDTPVNRLSLSAKSLLTRFCTLTGDSGEPGRISAVMVTVWLPPGPSWLVKDQDQAPLLPVRLLAQSIRAAEVVDPKTAVPTPSNRAIEAAFSRFDGLRFAKGHVPTAELRLEMQKTMQQDAAVFRTDKTLAEGQKVEFTVTQGQKGPQAENIVAI